LLKQTIIKTLISSVKQCADRWRQRRTPYPGSYDFDGEKFLDVGTGPAVQAAKRGFRVIGSFI